jgi:hypothetical protein
MLKLLCVIRTGTLGMVCNRVNVGRVFRFARDYVYLGATRALLIKTGT